MPDTILNTNATTSVLATNGADHTSAIDTAGDQDWWSVTLSANTVYQFRLIGDGPDLTKLNDPYLNLLNAAGTSVRSDDNSGGGRNSLVTYASPTTSTYYVSAQGNGSYTGNYILTATQVSTTALTANGNNHAGAIAVASETDWWAVTLTAGTIYQFSLAGNGLADSYLSLMNPSGALLRADDNGGGGRNSLITYAPTSTGIYYLTAQGTGSFTGNYNLAATPLTTNVLAVDGNNHVGTIGLPAEKDWWTVTLTANVTYDLRLTGNGLADPYLSLMNSTGDLIRGDDDGGGNRNSLITYTPTATGNYYVSTQGYGSNIGDYILTATARAASADSILATTGTAASLTINNAASTGTIETSTDQDWWSVALTAGTTYEFRMETNTGVAANQQLRDTYLRLLNPAGNSTITFNDDNGGRNGDNSIDLDSAIRYTPGTTGTYFLSAEGFNGLTGGYTIRATSVAASTDTIDAGITTASTLAVGASADGVIDSAGDRDAWAVTLTAGNSYQFQLIGTLVDNPATVPVGREIPGPSTLADTYLRLLNGSGGEIMANDDGGDGLNSVLTYTPTSNGTYYVVAAGYGNLTGNYTVSATQRSTAADIAAATTTGSTVTVNGAAGTSTIGMAGDNDWWKVSLTQGEQYRFQLDGTSLADPFLRLMDTTGLEIDSDDDSGSGLNSQIYYTAATTGIHYLSAQGFGADTGEYSLTAITDIAASMATSAVVTVNGAAGASTIGAIGDSDWWKVSLTQGQQYRFSLTETGLVNPFLALMNPLGAQITYDNDNGAGLNSEIIYTATTTGVYYLSAQGFGTETGGYSLTAATV